MRKKHKVDPTVPRIFVGLFNVCLRIEVIQDCSLRVYPIVRLVLAFV